MPVTVWKRAGSHSPSDINVGDLFFTYDGTPTVILSKRITTWSGEEPTVNMTVLIGFKLEFVILPVWSAEGVDKFE